MDWVDLEAFMIRGPEAGGAEVLLHPLKGCHELASRPFAPLRHLFERFPESLAHEPEEVPVDVSGATLPAGSHADLAKRNFGEGLLDGVGGDVLRRQTSAPLKGGEVTGLPRTYHCAASTVNDEDVIASLHDKLNVSHAHRDRKNRSKSRYCTLTAFTEPGRRSFRKAEIAAASGSGTMKIESPRRDPNPAALAASLVADLALSVHIAGTVK